MFSMPSAPFPTLPIVLGLAVATLLSASAPAEAQPSAVESDWGLLRSIDFDNPVSALYNPADGLVYVGQRGTTDGLYRLNAFGLTTPIAPGSNTAAICVDPDTGDVFQAEDYGGSIYRTAFGTTGREVWVSGLHSGDDDPVGMAIAPADYSGDVLAPGEALVVDRGNSGLDEIWRWSPDVAQGETVLHADDGTLVDAVDVAIDATSVYVVDTGLAAAGTIYEVGAGGSLTALSTSVALADPSGITVDPWNGDLLVLDHGTDQVVRVDRANGQVDVVLTGFAMSLGWSGIDVSADGRRLLVTDFTSDRIYEFGRCGSGPGFVDCNGNGVHDACDISRDDALDCNGNGVPDDCDIALGTSQDCDANGVPDECPSCPPVELVFVMDTSASMDDEASALCASLDAVIAELDARGLDLSPRLLATCNLPGGAYGCLEDHVSNLLGTTVPGSPPAGLEFLGNCPGGNEVCQEDWGLATAVVAGLYPWQPVGQSVRLVTPLSDEGAWCGDPSTDTDDASIDHAFTIAQNADVVVSPVAASGSSGAVIAQAQEIADATGGEVFFSSTPSVDIAEGIVEIVLNACVASSDCNGNGTLDSCDISSGASTDDDGDGVPDECAAVGVRDHAPSVELRLFTQHPNPFNPRTTITFALTTEGPVRLQVFDAKGRLVRTLVDGLVADGMHEVVWDGRDDDGRDVPSGVYFSRVESRGQILTRKMALVR